MLKSFTNWLKGLFGKKKETCVCNKPVEIEQVVNFDKPAAVEKKIDNTKKIVEKNIENIDVNKKKELKDNVKKEVIKDIKIEKIDNTLKNVEKADKVKRVQKNKSNKKQSEKVEKKVKKVSAESQQTKQVEKPQKKVTRKTTKKEDKKD